MKKIFLLLFINFLSYSQETIKDTVNKNISCGKSINHIEITGTITEIGYPLSDIIVFEKGTTNAVVSDENGKFSIKIPIENFKNHVYLRFESLVMVPKEIEVFKVTKTLNINMKSNDLQSMKFKFKFKLEPLKINWDKIINNNINTQLNKEKEKLSR